ncbi:MAG TPA: methylenetetrahydrofolate--tRNA-(uracil(54)-C(5))-methyltransferase (FADH(2)-oxidizing) TrmFO [Dissulfurispiraceae bacterium]|nr:methylenetetrahydrofolate--tRNA-(uracil(54)-C(5))-methyltransferase (FADH(2)-oxidizing) TrmFO [Dissulfurispiraceae bacterium]
MHELTIIGGGLAGCEAAWQAARHGIPVVLYEMRPARMTEAHQTGDLAELVCSNSLRSRELSTGPGLLKEELRRAGSLIMEAAAATEVPAGSAAAVDRGLFSRHIADRLSSFSNIRLVRNEITELREMGLAIVASGPLTSSPLASAIGEIIGGEHLYFYDAIAPIIDTESIDFSIAFAASRYGKGSDDYINCPMTKEEYNSFYEALIDADTVHAREFEKAQFFEGCMPVEVMAQRGRDTLCFGPLKPVGLVDPRTGKRPYAVVQLRTENRQKSAYNMVGFQTRLRQPSQKLVFRLIPGLKNAEFFRFGSIHRNTFINAPLHLNKDLSLKKKDTLLFAGQITGVEGYIESTAMGLLAGINASRRLLGLPFIPAPPQTAHGALIRHITESDPNHFQPSNINFGLIPTVDSIQQIRDKKQRRVLMAEAALSEWLRFREQIEQGSTVR